MYKQYLFRTFIASNNIPLGYQTPKFPSLYWPVGNEQYSLAYLYNVSDIWKFTLYWCLILNGIFYLGAATWAIISQKNQNYRRNNYLYNICSKNIHISSAYTNKKRNNNNSSNNERSSTSTDHHNDKRNKKNSNSTNSSNNNGITLPIIILTAYIVYAGIRGFVVGTVMGFLIGAIYRAGLFAMSTWIPLCCAVATVLYDVVMSFLDVGKII